jgi:hypothetical protein
MDRSEVCDTPLHACFQTTLLKPVVNLTAAEQDQKRRYDE